MKKKIIELLEQIIRNQLEIINNQTVLKAAINDLNVERYSTKRSDCMSGWDD